MLLRVMCIGVVYARNNIISNIPTTDSNGKWTVRSQSNFGDDSVRPVLCLQVVFPVFIMNCLLVIVRLPP